MWSHGAFYWNELMTRDAEAAKKFYGATLGWTYEAMTMSNGNYWIAKMGAVPVGGIFPLTSPEFDSAPEMWFAYIGVDNVDARAKKLTAAGGKILRPAFDVPNVGRIVVVQDNAGVMLGFMTPSATQ
jgi:predicted enzyme related to lactoylglutathione lyase